ncbi:flavin-containing monooxygenase family protein [Striga asiatica]|uniref:Flavin-containing monooxygenase family protein n=1 Tax=Striga asiatica TaxID=4170 RepID=A0A5A7P9T6_STRAF|nr:flavin-containing monooxygenase family protein [Striga asiatica]
MRTNVPRKVMGFRAYPFVASGKPERDPRRNPGHVRFGSEVSHVGFVEGRNWSVRSKIGNGECGYDEVYDAVVVDNGHYTEPRVADIPGIDDDFGLTRPTKMNSSGIDDDFLSIGRTTVADEDSGAFMNALYFVLHIRKACEKVDLLGKELLMIVLGIIISILASNGDIMRTLV